MVREFGLAPAESKNRSSFVVVQKTVAAAGTAEQLGAQVIPDGFKIVVKAKASNTGTVRVGHSAAAAQSATTAFLLSAGQSCALAVTNANLVFLDVTVSGEGVETLVET